MRSQGVTLRAVCPHGRTHTKWEQPSYQSDLSPRRSWAQAEHTIKAARGFTSHCRATVNLRTRVHGRSKVKTDFVDKKAQSKPSTPRSPRLSVASQAVSSTPPFSPLSPAHYVFTLFLPSKHSELSHPPYSFHNHFDVPAEDSHAFLFLSLIHI